MKEKNKLLYAVLVILLILYLDYKEIVGYPLRSLIKIFFFGLIPYLIMGKQRFKEIIHIHGNHKFGLVLALSLTSLIVLFYFLFGKYFDLSNIAPMLYDKYGIYAKNFLPVALYIVFINAFLEEFFFRGFLFLDMKGSVLGKSILSGVLFTLYHLSLFKGWFSFMTLFLAILSLFIAGLWMNFLSFKGKSILTSYFFHAGANIGINIVGFILMQSV